MGGLLGSTMSSNADGEIMKSLLVKRPCIFTTAECKEIACPISGEAQAMCRHKVPHDTFVSIFMWLPPTEYDHYKVRGVCRRFWAVYQDDDNWRHLCESWGIARGVSATWRRAYNKGARQLMAKTLAAAKRSYGEDPRALMEKIEQEIMENRSLDLTSCRALTSLPEGFGDLGNLRTLHVWHCEALTSLPKRFGDLGNLKTLRMVNCTALTSLPKRFGKLVALTELSLYGCEKLASLPEGFGKLRSLTSLDLGCCFGLKSLPEGFGKLVALTKLSLYG